MTGTLTYESTAATENIHTLSLLFAPCLDTNYVCSSKSIIRFLIRIDYKAFLLPVKK
jgi:hypothetical protein